MVHQSFAVDVENIRNELEPASRRKQQEEFTDGRYGLTALQQLLYDSAFRTRRDDGIRECPLKVQTPLHQIDKRGQIPFSGDRI